MRESTYAAIERPIKMTETKLENLAVTIDSLSTRLELARTLIAILAHNGGMPENMMTDGGRAWRAWVAKEKEHK